MHITNIFCPFQENRWTVKIICTRRTEAHSSKTGTKEERSRAVVHVGMKECSKTSTCSFLCLAAQHGRGAASQTQQSTAPHNLCCGCCSGFVDQQIQIKGPVTFRGRCKCACD